MSEIAEIRKIFQDLIAPDVKSIATEVAALKSSLDSGLRSAENLAEARYQTLIAKLETAEAGNTARHEQIVRALDIDRRLDKLERPIVIERTTAEREKKQRTAKADVEALAKQRKENLS